jgi:hypothetical protein
MAFSQITSKAPIIIVDISIQLFDPDPLGTESQGLSYSVQVGFDDGSIEVKQGDLTPHLAGGQITALQTFMADLRSQAVSEFLP